MESLHLHVTGPLTFRFLIPHHHHNHELLIDQLRRQLTTKRTVLSEAAAFCPVSRTTILRPFVRYRRRVHPDIGQNRTNVRTCPRGGVRPDRRGHPLLSGRLTVQFFSGTGRALRFTPTRFAESRMLFKRGRLAQLRRSSRRSVRPVRRSSRRSSRPVRRALRRSMPGVPVVGGGVAGVWAPACDAVRTAAGAAKPSTAAHPMRERARRREIKSEVMISLISITPLSAVQQNPWLVRIFDRTNVD